MVDSTTQTEAVSEQDPKSASMAQVQRERFGSDVGGKVFVPTKSTLLNFFGKDTVSPCCQGSRGCLQRSCADKKNRTDGLTK